MDWISLGHACWLVEAAGLRLLCDPLLEVEHYRGVFEVTPPRRLRAEALRADFILVSHAHPDHFDVPSLRRLAQLDAESVVVTPDPLVAETARALGFSTVHEVVAGQRVELDGVTLVTTESVVPDEWGVMIATAEGVVWNQVDAVFRGVEHARAVTAASLAALGRERVDLALVHGRPMHEIAAQLGDSIAFPYQRYAELLAEIAAIDPAAIVPASSDTAHREPYAWLNRVVYPIDEARFVRDLTRVCPRARVLPNALGSRYRLRGGVVELEAEAGVSLIEGRGQPWDRSYYPFAIPPVSDAASTGAAELERRRTEVGVWVETELRPALLAAYPSFGVSEALRFVLEAVFPGQPPGHGDAWTIVVERERAQVLAGGDPSWDLYNLVIGTMLWEVITGRRSWGDVLLAGGLRAQTRAYAIDERGLVRAEVGETFVYYALSYADSIRRAVAADFA
jgi:hypothetical protein